MAFCLTRPLAEEFKHRLKNGEITPEKLNDMTSTERHAYFADFMGDLNAKQVNALFESKLLLKNQKQGMVTWAKQTAGLKPEVQRDLISRIEKMDTILNPKEQAAFLEDLASKKLGTDVTYEEAQKISELSNKITETKKDTGESEEKRIEYGKAVIDLGEYVSSLNPKQANLVSNIANLPKTAMSTLDFSALLRQGWGMIGRPEFYKNIAPMFKYAFSEEAYKNMRADILSRPTYDLMQSAGLRVNNLGEKLSQREEQFISTLLDKVPGVKGSERAYTGFLAKLRADVFDHLITQAQLAGEDIRKGSQATRDIANVVNDFTGSGNIGTNDRYSGAVPALNATLFSPRKLSATINMFNPERYLNPKVSKIARQAALRQLLGSLGITAGLLFLAQLNGQKIEKDPKSADFGKFIHGKTHFDITGGNGTYAVLLARLLSNKTKSSTTGNVSTLGEGYKPTTRADVALKFLRNKLSPLTSMAADFLYGSDAIGQPFKVTNEIKNRIIPLIITDTIDLVKKDPSNTILGALGDMFGVGVQTY